MDYRIKKNQIFKKDLPVPNHIRLDVYACKLTFEDYIKYKLEDKVPISCLIISDREIVERFGLENAKKLDWSILNIGKREVPDIKEILLRISPNTFDINESLYKSLSTKISPQDYSEGMRKKYPNREIAINENDNVDLQNVKRKFNTGKIKLEEIVKYWDYFKDKDFTYVLARSDNEPKITNEELKEFMSKFRYTAQIICTFKDLNELIREINDTKDENKKIEILSEISEKILNRTYENTTNYQI